jgi:stress-induced morphogen
MVSISGTERKKQHSYSRLFNIKCSDLRIKSHSRLHSVYLYQHTVKHYPVVTCIIQSFVFKGNHSLSRHRKAPKYFKII